MKKTLMAAASMVLISISTLAEDTNQINVSAGYQSAAEIFAYGNKTQQVKKSLEDAQYELIECRENMIYYFVEPSENLYKKSSYTCTYKIPALDRPFDSDYAELSINIFYNKNIMLHNEGNVSLRYWTIY